MTVWTLPRRMQKMRDKTNPPRISHSLLFCSLVLEVNISFLSVFTARCYAYRGYATVCRRLCLSVQPSVTFRYRDHTGRNISEIISRLISFRFTLGLTPTQAIWSNGNTPKIRAEYG